MLRSKAAALLTLLLFVAGFVPSVHAGWLGHGDPVPAADGHDRHQHDADHDSGGPAAPGQPSTKTECCHAAPTCPAVAVALPSTTLALSPCATPGTERPGDVALQAGGELSPPFRPPR